MPSHCVCDDHDDPLASFCGDDLYCPQCGGEVAWLRSPNILPNPNPDEFPTRHPVLWVYAAEQGGVGNRFTFPWNTAR